MKWGVCIAIIHVICSGHCHVVTCILWLLIQKMYSPSCEDIGCIIMYPFAFLAFECTSYTPWLALKIFILFTEHVFPYMKYDFLRSVIMGWKIAFYYGGLIIINWCWEKNVPDVSLIMELFSTCTVSLCLVSDRSIVDDGGDSSLSSIGFCEDQTSE